MTKQAAKLRPIWTLEMAHTYTNHCRKISYLRHLPGGCTSDNPARLLYKMIRGRKTLRSRFIGASHIIGSSGPDGRWRKAASTNMTFHFRNLWGTENVRGRRYYLRSPALMW